MPTPMPMPKTKTPKLLLVLVIGSAGFFVVLVLLRVFVFQIFRIPSGSMLPTLAVSQRFLVNGLARPPLHRGDVIVFKFPEHPEQDFVKRVIALGGDTLDVTGGHPVINGWAVPSCKVGAWSYDEPDAYAGSGHHKGDVYVEFLEEAAYLTFYDDIGAVSDHQGPYRAKSGESWVMGDNRNNSHDSRTWFGGQGGGVPDDLVKGTLFGTKAPPELPTSMSGLSASFEKCMAARPSISQATPPPPSR